MTMTPSARMQDHLAELTDPHRPFPTRSSQPHPTTQYDTQYDANVLETTSIGGTRNSMTGGGDLVACPDGAYLAASEFPLTISAFSDLLGIPRLKATQAVREDRFPNRLCRKQSPNLGYTE